MEDKDEETNEVSKLRGDAKSDGRERKGDVAKVKEPNEVDCPNGRNMNILLELREMNLPVVPCG